MKHMLHIEKSAERGYPRLAFEVPEATERIDIQVSYPDRELRQEGEFTVMDNRCVIDFALESPAGRLFGAAGSDRTQIHISPLGSSAGFLAEELTAGKWNIVAGAYHVPPSGVDVVYDIEITQKQRRLFRGDTHAHTIASDGAFSVETLASLAQESGLDYLFITDHNNVSAPPHRDDITLLPGVEWTHYRGHAGLLGSSAPLPGRYDTMSEEETAAFLQKAQQGGAMTVLNHPFCPLVPWLWSLNAPHDALEVWNGVMSERNERAIAYWHSELAKGKRVVALGGSDYHRPGLFGSIATPCMMVYAPSRSRADILSALKRGDCFISYQADGPVADVACQLDGMPTSFGGEADAGGEITFHLTNLRGADEIRLITDKDVEVIVCPAEATEARVTRRYLRAAFVRVEVSRVYAPGLPPMKAMLTNPVYFHTSEAK